MDNRYFSDEQLAVLTDAGAWRLVSSFLPPDTRPLNTVRIRRWAMSTVERHPQQEIVIALSGSGFFGFQGVAYPCRRGDVFFIDAHEEHGYPYPAFYPDVDHLLIQITHNTVLFRTYSLRGGKEFPKKAPSRMLMGTVALGLLKETLATMKQHAELPAVLRRHQLLGAVGFLAGKIVTEGFLPVTDATLSREGNTERMVRVVQGHIEQTSGCGVTLDSLAALTGYSKYHLFRLFKSTVGRTIHEYIDAVRIQKTAQMLSDGRAKKEIAASLGFSCPAAFSRWMRARCPSFVGDRR